MSRQSYQKYWSGGAAPGAAALLALALSGKILGEGVIRDSIGAISSGRGGTNLAYSDNLALINDNPAGLARMAGLRFELNADFLKADIDYKDPQNSTDERDEYFFMPAIALSAQVLETPRPVVVGLGFFLPAGYGAEYKMLHPAYGRQKYETQVAIAKLLACVSADLGHGISLGAGVGPAYQQAVLETPYTFQTGAMAGVPALVDLDADGFGIAWNVGVQWRITERWTVGLAYTAETRVELEGDFDADVTGVVPVPDPDANYDIEFENTWPRSLGIGTAYRFDRGTASLDLLWFDWSSAFDVLTLKLKHGDNPTFDFLTGTTRPTDKFPLEWHDSYTLRLGGELAVTPEDTLRAGYIYVTNPVPERTMTPLIPAILEHSFSVGYGRKLGPQVTVDLAYQISFGRKRDVNQSEIIGGDFDNSELRAMAHWWFAGLSLRF